jgi:predicted RNA-binding protein associated with RNAse of E/G family
VSEQVRLHYHRPPDRTDLFIQELLYESSDVVVTYLASTPLKRPLVVAEEIALEAGAPAVWFTFPGLMHDIGRFHTADGTFTGLYSNIIDPVTFHSRLEWSCTDLFLDVWVGRDGDAHVLDRDELEHALASGWITEKTSAAALAEADRVLERYHAGTWPPAIVNEWPLSRVRKTL